MWQHVGGDSSSADASTMVSCHAQVWSPDAAGSFDEHGDLPGGPQATSERLEIELKVTTKAVNLSTGSSSSSSRCSRKRSQSCDNILKSCGLDLKLLTFRCIPVGKRRGVIEWAQGSVPLSGICRPFAVSISGRKKDAAASTSGNPKDDPLSSVAKAGLTKYESLRRLAPHSSKKGSTEDGTPNNPILSSWPCVCCCFWSLWFTRSRSVQFIRISSV
jgi:hypothetical protein